MESNSSMFLWLKEKVKLLWGYLCFAGAVLHYFLGTWGCVLLVALVAYVAYLVWRPRARKAAWKRCSQRGTVGSILRMAEEQGEITRLKLVDGDGWCILRVPRSERLAAARLMSRCGPAGVRYKIETIGPFECRVVKFDLEREKEK